MLILMYVLMLIKFWVLGPYLENCIDLQIQLLIESLMEANTHNCVLLAFEKWVIYGFHSLIQNCIVIKNITNQNPKSKKKSMPHPNTPWKTQPKTLELCFMRKSINQLHESHFDSHFTVKKAILFMYLYSKEICKSYF